MWRSGSSASTGVIGAACARRTRSGRFAQRVPAARRPNSERRRPFCSYVGLDPKSDQPSDLRWSGPTRVARQRSGRADRSAERRLRVLRVGEIPTKVVREEVRQFSCVQFDVRTHDVACLIVAREPLVRHLGEQSTCNKTGRGRGADAARTRRASAARAARSS